MKPAPHVPVVPWTANPVYRVLREPVFRARQVGGWTATGETTLTTSDLAEALRVCFDFKRSCVVESHGVVLGHNRCKELVFKRSNHGFRFHYV